MLKKQVSLREIVGTKIVLAAWLVSYYWMWARSSWEDWYPTAQSAMWFLFECFFLIQLVRLWQYRREPVDELAERNLKRCDSICLKLFVGVMLLLAWGCALLGHAEAACAEVIGWVIVLTVAALSVIRTVLFCVMDSKGI